MKRLIIMLGLLAFAGCDKKADDPAAGGAKATENKVELTDDDLPVRADFMEEAESSISSENYKSELDKLTTEIEKE